MTRVVVIQHVLELAQRSNTLRDAARVIPSLELRIFGEPPAPQVANAAPLPSPRAPGSDRPLPLRADDLHADAGAWLLWPGGASQTPAPKPKTIVVLDGSWSQARKMLQRVPELRALPQWSLAAPEGRRSLRAAPPGGMSSLEALAWAIEAVDGAEAARPIHEAHEALVQKQLRERGYVGPMR